MIVCRDCGHQNEDDDQFCGSCGAFLEFSGDRITPGASAVAAFADDNEEAERLRRVKQALDVDRDTLAEHEATAARVATEDEELARSIVAAREAEEAERQRAAAEAAAAQRIADAEYARAEAAQRAEAAEREMEALENARVEDQRVAEQAQREAEARAEQERLDAMTRAEAEAREERARAARELEARLVDEQQRAARAQAEAEAEAERARQAEAEAEVARRDADRRLVESAAAAAAAVLRAQQEQDAIAAADAARLRSEAEAAQARAQAEATSAAAAEEVARARAEAEAARAEAATLRAHAQRDEAQRTLERERADAARREAEEVEAARRRAEDAAKLEAERRRAADETEALRRNAARESEQREAEAQLAARQAEAKAATARADEERARAAAEAEASRRAREEALRKAAALVAPATVASTSSTASSSGTSGTATQSTPKPTKPTGRAKADRSLANDSAAPSDSAATGSGPGARLPGQQAQRVAPKRAAGIEVNPGDVVCGQCGVGNLPSRKFCRRCGTSLLEAKPVKLGFFARLRAKRRAKKEKIAGARPGERGGGRRRGRGGKGLRGAQGGVTAAWWNLNTLVFRAVAFLGVLAVFGFGVEPIREKLKLPNVREKVIQTIRRTATPTYDPIRPIAATTSSSASGSNPSALIDLGNNTTWLAAPTSTGGVGTVVTVSFDKPVNLARVLLTSGRADSGEAGQGFVSQPRPSELRVVFDGDVANPTIVKIKDSAEPQTLSLKRDDMKQVSFAITGVYPSADGKGKSVAITEIEFFEKRKIGDNYTTLRPPSFIGNGGRPTSAFGDEDLATSWTSEPANDGIGQIVTMRFPSRTDIDRIRIAPGKTATDFQTTARPKEVQLALTCQGQCPATKQVTVKDKPGWQTFSLKGTGVTEIVLTVRSVHGTGGVSFAGIEFQQKKPQVQ